ncbi:MAG: nucleotide exchange factor GrpE [Spirochaetales bacterium]
MSNTNKEDLKEHIQKKTGEKEHHHEHCENCGEEHKTHATHRTCDCEKEKEKANEYLNLLQRTQAEFDNYRKRNELLAIQAKAEGIVFVVEKLLPVLDSLNVAEKQVKKEELVGFQLVKEQLLTALKNIGVEQIDALGKQFDPNLHNVIMMGEDKTKESGLILEVLQEGYRLNDKVIRHSVVKING